MEPSELEALMKQVYIALEEKGLNPILQIMGYILDNDPRCITNNKQARARIKQVDRRALMYELLSYYFSSKMPQFEPIPPPKSSEAHEQ